MKDKRTWMIPLNITSAVILILVAVQCGIAEKCFYVSAWIMVVVTIGMVAMNYTNIMGTRRQAENNIKADFWKLRYDAYIDCRDYFEKVESELTGEYKGDPKRFRKKEKFDKLSEKIGFLFEKEAKKMMDDMFDEMITWAIAASKKQKASKECILSEDGECIFWIEKSDEENEADEEYKIACMDDKEAGNRFMKSTEELYAKLCEKLRI